MSAAVSLECPRCGLTVLGAVFDSPPVECPLCSVALHTRRSHLDAGGFERLVGVIRERAERDHNPDGGGSCA